MKLDELIENTLNERGVDLLERIVVMLTTSRQGLIVDGVDHVHDVVPVHERGHDHGGEHDDGHDHAHRIRANVSTGLERPFLGQRARHWV